MKKVCTSEMWMCGNIRARQALTNIPLFVDTDEHQSGKDVLAGGSDKTQTELHHSYSPKIHQQ